MGIEFDEFNRTDAYAHACFRMKDFSVVAEESLGSWNGASCIISHYLLLDLLGAQRALEDIEQSVSSPWDCVRDLLGRCAIAQRGRDQAKHHPALALRRILLSGYADIVLRKISGTLT